MFKLVNIALFSAPLTNGLLFPKGSRTCQQCLHANQRACLDTKEVDGETVTDFENYSCCTPNSHAKACWDTSGQSGKRYCSTIITDPMHSFEKLTNKALMHMACPINANYCDKDVDVVVSSNDKVTREKSWQIEVPVDFAANWDCKYRVRAGKQNKEGFVVVQVQTIGFDEEVTIISQPTDATSQKGNSVTSDKNIVDFMSNSDGNGVRVYQAKTSQKFFFPASNDVFVQYAPIRNKPGPLQNTKTFDGRFKLQAWYQDELTNDDQLDTNTVVDEQYKVAQNDNSSIDQDSEIIERPVFESKDCHTLGDEDACDEHGHQCEWKSNSCKQNLSSCHKHTKKSTCEYSSSSKMSKIFDQCKWTPYKCETKPELQGNREVDECVNLSQQKCNDADSCFIKNLDQCVDTKSDNSLEEKIRNQDENADTDEPKEILKKLDEDIVLVHKNPQRQQYYMDPNGEIIEPPFGLSLEFVVYKLGELLTMTEQFGTILSSVSGMVGKLIQKK